LKKASILILASIILLSTTAPAQTRRRTTRRSAPASRAATEKSSAELLAARGRVAAQIKTLSQFLYLYGGIAKGIESADQASRSGEASQVASEQNARTKARVKESIRNVRDGLDKLEADIRFGSDTVKNYYPYISGVARTAEMAESQAAANRFDEAGRSLLKAVNQLADALTAMR
jgi:hypothetical protein